MADTAPDPIDATTDETPTAFCGRWIAALDRSEKDKKRQTWLKRSRKILKLYRQDEDESAEKRKFALFWSNIETLKPAIYARTPVAVVSRRFKDNDPVGRQASEVLERSTNFSVDAYDFASVMEGVRNAFLLIGSGQVWVRYIPTITPVPAAGVPATAQTAPSEPVDSDGQVADGAENYETVDWGEVRADLLNYEDFGHNAARQWSEVDFVWRRSFMNRRALKDRFGDELGVVVPLDWTAKDGAATDDPKTDDGEKAAIYEIWDKCAKEVIWLSRGYPEKVLDRRPDPLGLDDFFPCPRPVLGTTTPDSVIPVPDYVYYQSQLREIDKLTVRIDKLMDALKVRGFYSAAEKGNLDQLLSSDTGIMIPVDSWAALADKGGIKGLIDWFPVDMVATVLKGCFDARKQIISDVYQITGISDILRGDTDPNETATAQQIKASWGSSRVRDRQKELARFARDVLRIMGEVIASKFDQQTLAKMTGVKMLTGAEKQQAMAAMQAWQQVAAQAQQQGAQPPPNPVPQPVQEMLQSPTWDDVEGLLHDRAMRTFRVEIETDSTIEPNDQEEKQRRVEFVTAVGKYLAESLPVVQAAPQMLPVITEGLKFLVRGFRVGREMEETIDRCLDQLQAAAQNASPQGAQQKPSGPDPQAQQTQAQASMVTAQARLTDARTSQQEAQTDAFRAQSEHQVAQQQVAAENHRTDVSAATDIHATIAKAEDRRAVREINDTSPITVNTR